LAIRCYIDVGWLWFLDIQEICFDGVSAGLDSGSPDCCRCHVGGVVGLRFRIAVWNLPERGDWYCHDLNLFEIYESDLVYAFTFDDKNYAL